MRFLDVSRLACACAVATLMLLPTSALGAAFEPNDSLATAAGPVLGGQDIVGAMETENDQDWFKFFTAAGPQQVEVVLTDTAPPECFGQYIRLTQADGAVIDGPPAQNQNVTARVRQTLEGSSTYYVQVVPYSVAPCIGPSATYKLRVEPASALVSRLPVPPAATPVTPPASTPTDPQKRAEHRARCSRARSAVTKAGAGVRSARARLMRAQSPRSRRAARRALRLAKKRLSSATKTRNYECQNVRFPGDAPLSG